MHIGRRRTTSFDAMQSIKIHMIIQVTLIKVHILCSTAVANMIFLQAILCEHCEAYQT